MSYTPLVIETPLAGSNREHTRPPEAMPTRDRLVTVFCLDPEHGGFIVNELRDPVDAPEAFGQAQSVGIDEAAAVVSTNDANESVLASPSVW